MVATGSWSGDHTTVNRGGYTAGCIRMLVVDGELRQLHSGIRVSLRVSISARRITS
jgi:hypothetical protein